MQYVADAEIKYALQNTTEPCIVVATTCLVMMKSKTNYLKISRWRRKLKYGQCILSMIACCCWERTNGFTLFTSNTNHFDSLSLTNKNTHEANLFIGFLKVMMDSLWAVGRKWIV
jgi:hypothetical protein